jgi:plastocyanin
MSAPLQQAPTLRRKDLVPFMNRSLFALRRGALSLALSAALVAMLAACGSSGSSALGGGTIAVVDGVAEISAADLTFDANVIQAPAGEAFTVAFTNNEGVPHNFSVYVSEGGEEIATGEIINEGQTDEVEIPALEPGTYFFVCDLHPTEMRGTIVVEG